jgi:two-component system, NarL family, sensor histidine kinase UhpB
MSDVLRVLLVEDSEDDAELMRREIRRGGYEPRFHRVADPEAMQRALDEQEWDLVISDYVMPGFGGLEALELFKRRNLDIPFLVVSGHIGEDRAVETMRAGADDYLMKDRLARLVPAITRELREAVTRKGCREADRALRESEERFRQLAENIGAVFFMFDRPDAQGVMRLLYVSPDYEKIWERSTDSLYNEPSGWLKAAHPGDRVDLLAQLPQLARGEFSKEFRIIRLDARVRWIYYRAFPVFNEQGAIYRIAAIAEDITERKEAAEQVAAGARRLEDMVEELTVVEERLRESNRELSESRAELEERVLKRTADLTAANAELQRQIQERMRLERDLLEVAEKERQRIGFDLHDDLSQQMMGVAFLVKALERKVANQCMPSEVEARQIQTLIDEVINHTHDLAHDFSSLDRQGDDLESELTKLAAKVKKMFGVSCRFSRKGVAPPLPQNVVAHLYKIAQESASNAVKHGRAKEVSISLSQRNSELILSVRNDGLPIPESRKASDRMGLRIMNSRANLIGAALKIKSNGEDGTVVTCTLPLEQTAKPIAPKRNHSNSRIEERRRPAALLIDEAECAA